mmetsp:Transcript_55122/g.98382  ORF Transcript_55122/g.98382 Transcript_55122/m.98382 type:complete len:802 (+) Transcript_55122:71-2476(+)
MDGIETGQESSRSNAQGAPHGVSISAEKVRAFERDSLIRADSIATVEKKLGKPLYRPSSMKISTPWFVPAQQHIELFFFHRVFERMQTLKVGQKTAAENQDVDDFTGSTEVPLVDFQRAMVRFLKAVGSELEFDVKELDANQNCKINWIEFCKFWQEQDVMIEFSMAERMFLTLEDPERSIFGKIMSVLVFIAIQISTGSFIISTIPELQDLCAARGEDGYVEGCVPQTQQIFKDIEFICVAFFTLEYGLRLILAGFMRQEIAEKDKNQLLEWMCSEEVVVSPTFFQRTWTWALGFSNVIDLAAIMPWYLTQTLESSNSNSALLNIIRLTRVFRAFRLGRRFEAVIIIMRSLKRSLRALYVLALNLFLGMIIFGSAMYFAEQGNWNESLNAYVREVDEEWNATSFTWEPVLDRSPFESIPSCFWWAIVTATTVGYGDIHTPTTLSGKVVATISMVWSLCVLALPIGVIGANFSQVWQEYDREQQALKIARRKQEAMEKQSMAWGDPLFYARIVTLEVWHNSDLTSSAAGEESKIDMTQSEFLGEVEVAIEIHPSETVLQKVVKAPLVANFRKSRRLVRGTLTFEYSWIPDIKSKLYDDDEADTLLKGRLEVMRIRADDCLDIDYKGDGFSDPFCVVKANVAKTKDGEMTTASQMTGTIWDSNCPRWQEQFTFNFGWYKVEDLLMAETKRVEKRRSSMRRKSTVQGAPDSPAEANGDGMNRIVGQLQGDLGLLMVAVPQLQEELKDARKDMQLILDALKRKRSNHLIHGGQDTVQRRTSPKDDFGFEGMERPRSMESVRPLS